MKLGHCLQRSLLMGGLVRKDPCIRLMSAPRVLVFSLWCVLCGVLTSLVWHFLPWHLAHLASTHTGQCSTFITAPCIQSPWQVRLVQETPASPGPPPSGSPCCWASTWASSASWARCPCSSYQAGYSGQCSALVSPSISSSKL